MTDSGKTRSFDKPPVSTFQAECGDCGWEGQPRYFKALMRDDYETHACAADKPEPLLSGKQGSA